MPLATCVSKAGFHSWSFALSLVSAQIWALWAFRDRTKEVKEESTPHFLDSGVPVLLQVDPEAGF